MSDIVAFAPVRALDRNGDPVPGARALFYLSGTTTPVTVYADQDEETPHPSPLLANADGVFPAVYCSGAALRVVVTDPDEVVLPGYPMDPVVMVGGDGGSADGVSFSATPEIPAVNVQAAIERVQANLEELPTDDDLPVALTQGQAENPASEIAGLATGQRLAQAVDARAPTLSQAQAENPASTVAGRVTGQRLRQAIDVRLTTARVMELVAAASQYAVGQTTWCVEGVTGANAAGTTVPGSDLNDASVYIQSSTSHPFSGQDLRANSGAALTGTWLRLNPTGIADRFGVGLFRRVA